MEGEKEEVPLKTRLRKQTAAAIKKVIDKEYPDVLLQLDRKTAKGKYQARITPPPSSPVIRKLKQDGLNVASGSMYAEVSWRPTDQD